MKVYRWGNTAAINLSLNENNLVYLTIIPRDRMGSESILAHSAFGLMGY